MVKKLCGENVFMDFLSPDGVPSVAFPDDMVIPDELDEDIEYVIDGEEIPEEEEEEIPEQFKGLSKKQMAEYILKQEQEKLAGSGNNQNNDIAAALNALNQNLVPRQQSDVANRSGLSNEEFRKKFNESIINSDDPYAAVQEAIQKELGGILNNVGGSIGMSALMSIQLDPNRKDLFNKYYKDILGVFNQLSPDKQLQAGAADWAYNTVIAAKLPEILAEAGKVKDTAVEDPKPKPVAYSQNPLGGGNAGKGGNGNEGRKKKVIRVKPTAADYEMARQTGFKPEEIALSRMRRQR